MRRLTGWFGDRVAAERLTVPNGRARGGWAYHGAQRRLGRVWMAAGLFFLHWALAAGSGPALVQSATRNNGGLDRPTATASFAADNTAGNLIVVAVTLGALSRQTHPVVADTQGNIYYPITSQLDWLPVGGGGSSQLFYAPNIKGGPNTVTMTEVGGYNGAGNSENQIAAYEYTGLTPAFPLDAESAAWGAATGPSLAINSGLITTTGNGELIFGFGNTDTGVLSPGPGFSARTTGFALAEDLVQSGPGPIAATANDNVTNDAYVLAVAAFRPEPEAGGLLVLPTQPNLAVVATVPLLVTNTAVEVDTNPAVTQTILFNYTNRDALLADGWSFIATNSTGLRNTEITNSATGAVISYDQSAHPGTLEIPCDIGDLFGSDNNTRNSLFHGLSSNWVSLRLELAFAPVLNYEQANLALYQDDDNYVQVGVGWNSGILNNRGVILVSEIEGNVTYARVDLQYLSGGVSVTNLQLRLDRNVASGSISGFCSLDGLEWQYIGTFNQSFPSPSLALWVGGSTVPYTNGLPVCDLQQLEIVTRNPGPLLTYQLAEAPTGASIDGNGIIKWTPTLVQGGTTNSFRTIVTDNQALPNAATNLFQVRVLNPTNTVPVLPAQSNLVVNELSLLVVTNTATDGDIPAETLTYTLVNAPAGATIDTNGIITWTPSLGQGTNTYTLTTVVTDSGSPPLGATNSFQVTVNAVNLPPLLPAQSDQTIPGLTPLLVANTAMEADSRGLPLTYQLVSGPTNAAIDTNGVISWTPVVAQVPSTNVFTTVVSDNDPWAVNGAQLSATNSFVVVVLAQPLGNGPRLPVQISQTVSELATLVVTNTASYVGSASQWATNTILFTYSNRDALLADGWSFIARQAGGAPRNTEITNAANGALVDYDQSAHPGVLRIPCDIGDLWGPGGNTRNSLFRTLPTNWFSLRLALVCAPTQDYQQAHLGIYQDDDNYLDIGIAYNDSLGGRVTTYVLETNAVDNHFHALATAITNITYQVDRGTPDGTVAGRYSTDGVTWSTVGSYANPLPNPRLVLWAGSTSVPYVPGAAVDDMRRLDVVCYNGLAPVLSYQLVNPPPGATIDTNGVITWTPASDLAPGTYTLTTLVTDNGTPPLSALNSFSVVVLERNLTITANDAVKTYDGLPYSGGNGVTYSGFVNGDTPAVLEGALTYGGTSQGAISAGSYPIVPGGLTSTNYSLTFVSGMLIINKATITVKALNTIRLYGQTNPVLAASFSGFVDGQNTNVLVGSPSLSTPATPTSPPGVYPIVDSIGSLSATNYNFSLLGATLTVVPPPPFITSVIVTNGVATITWQAVSNLTYRLQRQADLNGTNWQDVLPTVTATSSSASATDASGLAPAQFYRVLLAQ